MNTIITRKRRFLPINQSIVIKPIKILDWLNTIEDKGLKQLAILNFTHQNHPNKEAANLSDAIDKAFCWEDTEEGHNFWETISVANRSI